MKIKNTRIKSVRAAFDDDIPRFKLGKRNLTDEKLANLKMYSFENLQGEHTALEIFKIKYFNLISASLFAKLTGMSYIDFYKVAVFDECSYKSVLGLQFIIENFTPLGYLEELSKYLRGKR